MFYILFPAVFIFLRAELGYFDGVVWCLAEYILYEEDKRFII